jgi:hypothetical protein
MLDYFYLLKIQKRNEKDGFNFKTLVATTIEKVMIVYSSYTFSLVIQFGSIRALLSTKNGVL